MTKPVNMSKKDISSVHSLLPVQDPVIYVPLTSAESFEAAQIYTDIFLADEPTTIRHGPDSSFFLPYAEMYVQFVARKNVSFIARDKKTSEIIGFIFCLDFTSDIRDEGEQMVQFLNHFKATVAMMDELEDQFLNHDEIVAGSILHVFQIGVDKRYRKLGIAKALINQVLSQAHERGFTHVIADCTSLGSQKSFESCGFEMAGKIPYDSFCMDGVRFFDGLDGGISFMVKNLE